MAQVQVVVFQEPKAGSAPGEWEDGAGYDAGDPAAGRPARCMAVDGATEAFNSIDWANQLVDSFLGFQQPGGRPALDGPSMDRWFGLMQEQWARSAPTAFANIFEERKFREDGSFATMLGCEISGLATGGPRWSAVALGDTVLFHVRDGRVRAQFPVMDADDFGINPEGVFTHPSARERMRRNLAHADGVLAVGDRLFLATDAIAQWMVRRNHSGSPLLWPTLSVLDHPVLFRRLVADCRAAGELKNDDVTLMRVEVTEGDPDVLVVCE